MLKLPVGVFGRKAAWQCPISGNVLLDGPARALLSKELPEHPPEHILRAQPLLEQDTVLRDEQTDRQPAVSSQGDLMGNPLKF